MNIPNVVSYTNTSSIYVMNLDILNFFENKLANGNWGNILQLITKDPLRAISSLRMYPIDIKELLGASIEPTNVISLGGTKVQLQGATLFYFNQIVPYNINNRLLIRMVSNYHIERKFNNFLDYDPYTKLKIYLPYIATGELNVSEVMDKYITIYYALDLQTGNATAYIEARNNPSDSNPKLIAQITGTLGIDVPLGQTNIQDMITKNVVNTINLATSLASLGIGASTGNAIATGIGLVGTLKSTTIGTIEANREQHSKDKASGNFSSFYAPQDVYLIRETIKAEAIDYSSIKGRPMAKAVNLNLLEGKGFTKVGDVHLGGFNLATSPELEEIESYLIKGIIL